MIHSLADFIEDMIGLMSHKARMRVKTAYELGRRDAYLDVLDYLETHRLIITRVSFMIPGKAVPRIGLKVREVGPRKGKPPH